MTGEAPAITRLHAFCAGLHETYTTMVEVGFTPEQAMAYIIGITRKE